MVNKGHSLNRKEQMPAQLQLRASALGLTKLAMAADVGSSQALLWSGAGGVHCVLSEGSRGREMKGSVRSRAGGLATPRVSGQRGLETWLLVFQEPYMGLVSWGHSTLRTWVTCCGYSRM